MAYDVLRLLLPRLYYLIDIFSRLGDSSWCLLGARSACLNRIDCRGLRWLLNLLLDIAIVAICHSLRRSLTHDCLETALLIVVTLGSSDCSSRRIKRPPVLAKLHIANLAFTQHLMLMLQLLNNKHLLRALLV